MKYSILGFDQNKVLGLIDKVNANREKGQHIYIDVDDLLILSEVADLENRKSIRKIILDDGQYSWISYNLIIDDLPILRIGKKQLSRKIDKLAEFNLIELRVERIKGSGTFIYIRTGNEYEGLLYGNKGDGQKCTEGVDKNVYGDGQKCPPKDNITIQDNNNNKEERDKSLSKKDDLFEKCWQAYRRKGSKAKAKPCWNKLKDEEKQNVLKHIKAYVSVRDIAYQKDFERYLRDKIFETVVVNGKDIVYDPSQGSESEYHPYGNLSLMFSEKYQCYIYIGYYDGTLIDGYTDDERPDGATVMLNSGRGTIVWNKSEKRWILKK